MGDRWRSPSRVSQFRSVRKKRETSGACLGSPYPNSCGSRVRPLVRPQSQVDHVHSCPFCSFVVRSRLERTEREPKTRNRTLQTSESLVLQTPPGSLGRSSPGPSPTRSSRPGAVLCLSTWTEPPGGQGRLGSATGEKKQKVVTPEMFGRCSTGCSSVSPVARPQHSPQTTSARPFFNRAFKDGTHDPNRHRPQVGHSKALESHQAIVCVLCAGPMGWVDTVTPQRGRKPHI